MRLPYNLSAIALNQFNLAIIPAELFHLLDGVTPLRRGYGGQVSLQISLCALLQFAVNSLVIGIRVRQQSLSQRRSGQTLRYNKRIAPKRHKEFTAT